MKVYYDKDSNLDVIKEKKITIIGYRIGFDCKIAYTAVKHNGPTRKAVRASMLITKGSLVAQRESAFVYSFPAYMTRSISTWFTLSCNPTQVKGQEFVIRIFVSSAVQRTGFRQVVVSRVLKVIRSQNHVSCTISRVINIFTHAEQASSTNLKPSSQGRAQTHLRLSCEQHLISSTNMLSPVLSL